MKKLEKLYKYGTRDKNRTSITLDKRSVEMAKKLVRYFNNNGSGINTKDLIENLIKDMYEELIGESECVLYKLDQKDIDEIYYLHQVKKHTYNSLCQKYKIKLKDVKFIIETLKKEKDTPEITKVISVNDQKRIRNMKGKISQRRLAELYNCSERTINKIMNNNY